jgi:murein DD-endopeptidase MepM/ murein hydrolase activator NlpD
VTPGTRLVVPVYRAGNARIAERPARETEDRKSARNPEAARTAKSRRSDDVASARPRAKAEEMAAARTKSSKPEQVAATKSKGSKPESKSEEVASGKAKSKPGSLAAATQDKARLAQARNPQAPPARAERAKLASNPAPAPAKTAEPKKPASQAQVAESARPAAATDPTPTASLAPAGVDKPEFRWPARGRITQGFKPGVNDGINLAVPEGTSVKAAEAGVVAYAGNELKGYGNMVIIRHPNGFVTAYANNSEIDVKRGEAVKRGQIIAKSGQTGNTSSPQLHFEVRKGSTPVDPTQYLAGL